MSWDLSNKAEYQSKSFAVSTATPVVVVVNGSAKYPIGIRMMPGSGGTLLAETSRTPPGTAANWISRPAGSVASATDDEIVGAVTAIRFTATVSAGTVEVIL